MPVEFPTIGICDGIAQGHGGMHYPLASRELIADSIEVMMNAHAYDAMVLITNCDKITPGILMACVRLDVPAIIGERRSDADRLLQGQKKWGTPISCPLRGSLPKRVSLMKICQKWSSMRCRVAVPLYLLGTANSMNYLTEALGMCLQGAQSRSRVGHGRIRSCQKDGPKNKELLEKGHYAVTNN
ncbi:dihydroxy-acid dehydratase [Acetomicrobium sp.]|uniref:dihydroxy-acid dehydratase domain-containing protein n=1 Tax=Acetomicrobium sp. TaxID=1872099 RepID=UPI002FC6923E